MRVRSLRQYLQQWLKARARARALRFAYYGGAWKVAYADFVTAMMAFFLLLWLLSSADEATLDGLAEYFTPTIGIRDSMGIGFEGGESPETDGVKKGDKVPPGIVMGAVPQGPIPDDNKRKALIEAQEESNLFEKAEEAIKRAFESDPNLRDLADNIIVEQSPEGLKIEVMDSDKEAMFQPGRAVLSDYGRRTLGRMLEVVEAMPNFISITGHTDASPFRGDGNYTNWELSADRANAARRFMLRAGMEPERPKKVIGQGAAELLLPDEPKNARNRRITIILLRGSHMNLADWALPATRDLLAVPKARKTRKNVEDLVEGAEKAAEEKAKSAAPEIEPTTQLPDYYRDETLDIKPAEEQLEDPATPHPPKRREAPELSEEEMQEFME